jgi:hypothetical protein
MIEVTVTTKFWLDHVLRDGEGQVLRGGPVLTRVRLNPAEYDDLYGDARHYADLGTGMYAFDPSESALTESARATVRRLEKAGRGEPTTVPARFV